MRQVVHGSTASERFNMVLLSVFACSALLLAAIGVCGLTMYSVQQRTQEFGIRMALGASAGKLQRSIITQSMRLVGGGVVVGTAAAIGLTRVLEHLLFGVEPWDPVVFGTVPIILTAVAVCAVWLAARRAARVDPLISLRWE
ncbi:MAG: FtsX-like permease family protein [Bryobacteraceae bacterium]|nr:FtsX-like permease family protein [Bryobacteraceae bacterium]